MLCRKELKRCCDRDRWELYKETAFYFYRKILPDETVVRTKVSKGSGKIHSHLGQEILKKQLQTTNDLSLIFVMQGGVKNTPPCVLPLQQLHGGCSQ